MLPPVEEQKLESTERAAEVLAVTLLSYDAWKCMYSEILRRVVW